MRTLGNAYTGKRFKWQLTHSTNNLYENAEIDFVTVTSYKNALEQALQITYVTRSHELSLNSQPAYRATGKSSQWGFVWVFSGFCKIKVYKH